MKFKASHSNQPGSSSPKAPIDTVSNLAKHFSTCLTSHMWAGLDFCGTAHTYKVEYMHEHQGHRSKLGHVKFPSGDHYCLCAPKPSPVSSADLMAAWSHTWVGGEKDPQTWDGTASTCTASSGTSLCSEGDKENTLPKIYGTGRECEPLIQPGTSKQLCTSTAPASLLLCLPEADRKEGAELWASHPSMSQPAECAGQEL